MKHNNLAIIVAMTEEGVIGLDGKMPWHIHDELENFKKITTGNGGNIVIMGRKTYVSLGKPLDERINIVVSKSLRESAIKYSNVLVEPTLSDALTLAEQIDKDIFLIGGRRIYAEGLSLVDTMYISQIKKNYHGNIYFPKFNENDWSIKKIQEHPEFDLFLYKRK
jgi:dihydrofolate reductase